MHPQQAALGTKVEHEELPSVIFVITSFKGDWRPKRKSFRWKIWVRMEEAPELKPVLANLDELYPVLLH